MQNVIHAAMSFRVFLLQKAVRRIISPSANQLLNQEWVSFFCMLLVKNKIHIIFVFTTYSVCRQVPTLLRNRRNYLTAQ